MMTFLSPLAAALILCPSSRLLAQGFGSRRWVSSGTNFAPIQSPSTATNPLANITF
ncbi:MAG TPA: hypothetical protein VFD27_01445 [Chthoniobacteraceae bacterium]|nr:hypothetical protein [Chthoniobacteraceae bacterium]